MLTVSDHPEFLRLGGAIRFYTHEGKVRFQINLEPIRSAGLTISCKLLRLADIYNP